MLEQRYEDDDGEAVEQRGEESGNESEAEESSVWLDLLQQPELGPHLSPGVA